MLDLLHASKSRPVAVELLNGLPGERWALARRVSDALGHRRRLRGEGRDGRLAGAHAARRIEVRAGARSDRSARRRERCGPRSRRLQLRPESRLIGKASVLAEPSSREAAREARTAGFVHATRYSNGVDLAARCPGDSTAAGDGAIVIRRCPAELEEDRYPSGASRRGDRELMRHVKQTLDPENVFNPGRLFGDL